MAAKMTSPVPKDPFFAADILKVVQFGRTYDLVILTCHIESFKMAYDTILPKLHNFFLRNLRLAFGLAKGLYMLKSNHFKAL